MTEEPSSPHTSSSSSRGYFGRVGQTDANPGENDCDRKVFLEMRRQCRSLSFAICQFGTPGGTAGRLILNAVAEGMAVYQLKLTIKAFGGELKAKLIAEKISFTFPLN